MPTFQQHVHAARCGFTYSDATNRFFRFLVRGDGKGYDVDAVRPEAVHLYEASEGITLQRVQLDMETLRRVVSMSADLGALFDRPEKAVRLVVSEHGHLREGVAHEAQGRTVFA